MPADSVKERVTAMVRDRIGPTMKTYGFRRSGRVFWRDGPDVCHVATVAMARYGTSKQSDFGVHLGTYWHKVEELLGELPVRKMPPPEHKCTFRIDLGRTISSPAKSWWRVSLSSDFESIGKEVLDDLTTYGLPWFALRSELKHVLEWKRYASRDVDGRYWMQEFINADVKVVFKMMVRKEREAIADLKRFVKNGHTDSALSLAKRLYISKSKVMA